jgi:Clostripain family
MAPLKKKNEWTVMVYLAGDNNLSEEMIYSIKEMYRVGTNEEFELIVKFDPSAIGPEPQEYVISREKIEDFKKRIRAETRAKKRAVRSLTSVTPVTREPKDGTFNKDGFLVRLASRTDKSSSLSLGKRFKTPGGKPPRTRASSFQEPPVPENSADPQELQKFIRHSIQNHPAKHYMLVLSGHGSGAEGDFLPDVNPDSPGEPATSLSIPALGKVLKDALTNLKDDTGKRILDENGNRVVIDILGMDSCLMSMAEVGFQVKDEVNCLVASEGFELNTGWPYHRILEVMKEKLTRTTTGVSDLAAEDLANDIVEKYFDYYKDYQLAGASTDISACKLAGLESLATALRDLAQALNRALSRPRVKDAIVFAHWEAQSYKSDQYVDLWDFCDRLQQYQRGRGVPKTLIAQCEKVKSAIENRVVLKSRYSGAAFQHSHGISVYFPWTESDFFPIGPRKSNNSNSPSKYANLKFADRVGDWVEFLKNYLEETRRGRRNQQDNLDKNEEPKHPLRFDEPNETVLFVRGTTSNTSKATTDNETCTMKNPPDGFYQDKN